MNTAEQEIRTLRNKAKSWAAILFYNCAQGTANLKLFSRRLQTLFQPVLRSGITGDIIRNAVPKTVSEEDAQTIKKGIMCGLTTAKVKRRMLSFPKIRIRKAPDQNQAFPLTLGRLVIIWAVLTNQPVEDFTVRILPKIDRLFRDWHNTTGCSGLSDVESDSHLKETAIFWSGLFRILIRATPEENLIWFMHGGLRALSTLLETAGMGKVIVMLIGQATRLITKDATQKFKSALKENPQVKKRIDIPELQALVLREEIKLGWSNNTQEDAEEILQDGLSQELKEATDEKEEAVRSSIEAIGRRGLFNNLMDALNGKLRPRFIESIIRFLKAVVCVESRWEFDTADFNKENARSIRKWLFRR